MKTEKLEKWLLLEQTGELSVRRCRKLAACPEAQTKREELNALRIALPILNAEASPWVVTKIVARLRTECQPASGFSKAWKPALALAACLALVTAILNFHGEQTSSAPSVAVVATAGVDVWSVPIEEDLSKLESLIVAISSDPLDIMEM